MNKTFSIFTLALLLAMPSWGVRPRKIWSTLIQTDGTSINVSKLPINDRQYGYTTSDGWALQYNREGALCYLMLQGDSIVTSQIAHDASSRDTAEKQWLNSGKALSWSQYYNLKAAQSAKEANSNRYVQARSANSVGMGTYKQSAGGMVSSIGAPQIPVIMVEFTDKKFQPFTTVEGVNRLFNEEGYTDNYGTTGSIRDYFADNSDGLFTPHFGILGKVCLPNTYAYYGADKNGEIDYNCYRIVQDALDQAVAQNLDLSPYASTTGEIPLLAIYYAGMGEHVADNSAASEDLIWAHYQSLGNSSASVEQNGRTFVVHSYLVGDEAWPAYTTKSDSDTLQLVPSGNAVFIHEFCHSLGLPDFYNTTGDEQVNGMLYWSIMDSGEWWENGYLPVGMTAYEKNYLGWLEITDLPANQAKTCRLDIISNRQATAPRAYRIVNPIEEKEYYILENRQPSRWYPQELGVGMLITHVDYSSYNWNYNIVNNTHTRERMNFIPADNSAGPLYDSKNFTLKDFQGDLYPGITGNTEFSNQSTPSNTTYLYYQGASIPSIYNIANEDGIITFSYIEPNVGISDTYIHSSDNETVKITTIDGKYVGQMKQAKITNKLSKGIYIITGKEHSEKIIIE